MVDIVEYYPAYGRMDPAEIDEYFESREAFDGNLADLLLNSKNTALFHVEPSRLSYLGNGRVRPVMERRLMGVNYTGSHMAEARDKLLVQDVEKKVGPWILFNPEGADEKDLYLQALWGGDVFPAEFYDDVINPLKVKNFYVTRADPKQIFDDFKEAGYKFHDEPMDEAHYGKLSGMQGLARRKRIEGFRKK